jgi:hypothetical protein
MYGRKPYAAVAYAQFYEIVTASGSGFLVFQAQTVVIPLLVTGTIKVTVPIQ